MERRINTSKTPDKDPRSSFDDSSLPQCEPETLFEQAMKESERFTSCERSFPPQAAVNALARAAIQGHEEARFLLAKLMLEPSRSFKVFDHRGEYEVEEVKNPYYNREKGIELIYQLAENNYADAQWYLVKNSSCNNILKSPEVLKWITKLAEGGDSDAQLALANAWRDVRRHQENAIHWYEALAKKNHIGANYELGVIYLNAGNEQKAKDYFLAEVRLGDAQDRQSDSYLKASAELDKIEYNQLCHNL